MLNIIKMQKGDVIKTIPAEYKKDYINAGWTEVKQTKEVGVISSTKNENNKY